MTSVTYYPGYSQIQVTENLIVMTIESITQSNPMVVVTTMIPNYVVGMMVRFLIPVRFGMQQLNSLQGQVIEVSGSMLTINIDSTKFSSFAYPSPLPNAYSLPSIIPNSSGPPVVNTPLPFGNENTFDGAIYNAGQL